jgi:hypothetical protein
MEKANFLSEDLLKELLGKYECTWKNTVNPLTPELNPSSQRCLPRIFTGDFNF